jgi:hypothetical protein
MVGALLVAIAASLPGVHSPARPVIVPPQAVAAAERRAGELGARGFGTAATLRSRRDPGWSLVTGFARTGPAGASGPVALWLHEDAGTWVVRVAAVRPDGFHPRQVPCDLTPAFSHPSC